MELGKRPCTSVLCAHKKKKRQEVTGGEDDSCVLHKEPSDPRRCAESLLNMVVFGKDGLPEFKSWETFPRSEVITKADNWKKRKFEYKKNGSMEPIAFFSRSETAIKNFSNLYCAENKFTIYGVEFNNREAAFHFFKYVFIAALAKSKDQNVSITKVGTNLFKKADGGLEIFQGILKELGIVNKKGEIIHLSPEQVVNLALHIFTSDSVLLDKIMNNSIKKSPDDRMKRGRKAFAAGRVLKFLDMKEWDKFRKKGTNNQSYQYLINKAYFVANPKELAFLLSTEPRHIFHVAKIRTKPTEYKRAYFLELIRSEAKYTHLHISQM